MFYGDDGKPKTGTDLEVEFKKPFARHWDLNRHFRQWKLLFHDPQDNPLLIKIQAQLRSQLRALEKTPADLLSDWISLIYKDLFIEGKDGLYSIPGSHGYFAKKDVEIVVTVPPGRSVLAHDIVRDAFVQGPVGKGQVCLVSEPEAMFRSWTYDSANADPADFKVGVSRVPIKTKS
jgi:hypothetical protein